MRRLIVLLFFTQSAFAMLIPEDTEMLDGFGFVSYPELSPEDDYFEARSLSASPLYNSVRNKRAANYEVKESDDLISHFRANTVNGYTRPLPHVDNQLKTQNGASFRRLKNWLKNKFPQNEDNQSIEEDDGSNILNRRRRRSAEPEKKVKLTAPKDDNKQIVQSDALPIAMKLTKTSNGFSSTRDNPTSSALVGKFARSPFEYSKIQHDEDSMALDSSLLSSNEGIKSRTPRVNFVTQQKKSVENEEIKGSATKSDFYKTPPLLHNSKESTNAPSSERYPDRSSTTRPSTYPDYKDRDMNSNRYDDRYIEDMYPPPPPEMYDSMYDFNGPYDPYMRRPYMGYNSYNGGYPGNRYDIPDYRDFAPMYGNEIDNRYYMRSDMMPPMPPQSSSMPRKRTVYYAYLPEVVRSPPTVDFRYRSYDRYDNYYPDYYNQYESNMVSNVYRRPIYERPAITEKPAMKYDYRSPRPIKPNDEIVRVSSATKEKRFDQERPPYDSKVSVNTYVHRRPSEYDSFYY